VTIIDHAGARRDLVEWLEREGLTTPVAGAVVDHVLAAEVVGRPSHGLRLLPWIIRGAAAHERPDVGVEIREPGTLLVTAGGLPGIYALQRAVDEAIRAHDDGRLVVTVAVTGYLGSTGCLGLHARRLAMHGSTGVVSATSPAIMAPPGTITPVLGTNAIAVGAPVDRGAPLIADFSSGTWSYGDVAMARMRGEPIPEGVVMTRTGAPTNDPSEVVEGSILPSGGHRGWCQALLVEAIAGAAVGAERRQDQGADGALVMSIGSGAFPGSSTMAMRSLVDQVLAAEPGPDGAGAHVPGGRFARLDQQPDAIEVDGSTLDRLEAAGAPALSR
jgi:LDH2 family malate/lactate/ureidoglycolate dehydrogenase